MAQKDTKKYSLGTFTGDGFTNSGRGQQLSDYKNLVVAVMTSGNADLTFKVQCAYQVLQNLETPIDFSTTASASNPWDYVQTYDQNDTSTPIVGSTGVSTGGTDIVKFYVVNSDTIQQISVEVSDHSAGTLTAYVIATNNA